MLTRPSPYLIKILHRAILCFLGWCRGLAVRGIGVAQPRSECRGQQSPTGSPEKRVSIRRVHAGGSDPFPAGTWVIARGIASHALPDEETRLGNPGSAMEHAGSGEAPRDRES